ncbi:MAG: hypothetical protein H0V51_04945 [Chloroflexi bacterium]|nr:hypothetical protein [Chloroflexota bacterium]
MRETVYRVLGLVCAIVATVPIGTNLGLVWVFWMLVSGRLLATRGGGDPGPEPLGAGGAGGAAGVGGAGAGELAIESFFPADSATAAILRAHAGD